MRFDDVKIEPTRSYGRQLLAEFLPRVGDYSRERNKDMPGHRGVSQLSPWVRYRLLSEEEICREILGSYSWIEAEKFLQEVCWRTYWKGWLQLRPEVWERYLRRRKELREDDSAEWPERLRLAESGQTGLACFDHWVEELRQTGYLHNHARMWFASIWIFTWRLPWELGADFFLRHLLDGDPASNTLSWRWVAGLQTRGKHYVARAENIARFTEGRFNPEGQLNENPEPLVEEESWPEPQRLVDLPPPRAGVRRGWVLTGDDLSPEASRETEWPMIRAAVGGYGWVAEYLRQAELPAAFGEGACRDAARRLRETRQVEVDDWGANPPATILADWVARHDLEEICLLEPPVGPWAAWWGILAQHCPVPIRPIRRSWDESLWPRATAGFFKFKKGLPETVQALWRENTAR